MSPIRKGKCNAFGSKYRPFGSTQDRPFDTSTTLSAGLAQDRQTKRRTDPEIAPKMVSLDHRLGGCAVETGERVGRGEAT